MPRNPFVSAYQPELHVGDEVEFSSRFLRNSGWATCVPGGGKVVSLSFYNNGVPMIAEVVWADPAGGPDRRTVHVNNLVLRSRLPLEPV
jgi:hypothetical protein